MLLLLLLFAFLSLAAAAAYLFTKYVTIMANVSNESLISYLMFIHLVSLVFCVQIRAHFLYIYFHLVYSFMNLKPMLMPFPLASRRIRKTGEN